MILISLDGFRYDYAEKYHAVNIRAMGAVGATAPQGMIPAYPSLTFPNHLTLATGLYPEHHGIVANNFYDPARKQTYRLGVPATVTDGSWYNGYADLGAGGTAGNARGMLFLAGIGGGDSGNAAILLLKFDDKIPDRARVQQVLTWLRLPPERRPHLITLYFSEVDHAGHEYGPDSEQVSAAVQIVDKEVGILREEVAKLNYAGGRGRGFRSRNG